MALKLEIAQEILLNAAVAVEREQIQLENAWRRILAETVAADTDFPPFDRSPLDGYAIIAAETVTATPEKPVVLQEVDNVPAGSVATQTVVQGTACRIMTGAPLPPGATGVIRLEDTVVKGKRVEILDGRGADKNICHQGEEMLAGEEMIQPGTLVNVGVMGMLALLGNARPWVYKKPRVALIATGSEIVAVDEPLGPGKIRNSNSYMLSAQVSDAGGQVAFLGRVGDDVDAIAALLEQNENYDLMVTTGGASVGDYDLIGEVYKKLGITLLFDRVSMKPGMPVLAGNKNGKLYIGLSGNPAAAAISFELLVRPLLMKMSGRKSWWRPELKATLARPFAKGSGSKRFVWARCWQKGGDILADPLRRQGNGMLKSAMLANALIVIPPESGPLPAGTEVDVLLLTDA
ncbi:MAG TPA: gephyrin-like molybdotransferase Glp [Patescibacteria group bacterium]|nr:gephyrin-like molybdotransferase Glp [Patescibacteria group bacterium]